MPQVNVSVFCRDCINVGANGSNDFEIMDGTDTVFESRDNRTQSRIYRCPNCRSEVSVVLDFRGN